MTAELSRDQLVSPEEYLEGELDAPLRCEYMNGAVYSMAGATNRHNSISTNILGHLFRRLAGSACRPFGSDTKVRLQLPEDLRYYYPDAQVTCRPSPGSDTFQDEPCLIVEVISESTRRADESEKRLGYLGLPSMKLYLLVETEKPLIIGFRRTAAGIVREVYAGAKAVVPLGFCEPSCRWGKYTRILDSRSRTRRRRRAGVLPNGARAIDCGFVAPAATVGSGAARTGRG